MKSSIYLKMVNKCIVHGCTSGLVKFRNRNAKLNRRNTSLFTVPQHPDLVKFRSSGLNQQLIPKKQYVCELHFNEEDIIKSDKIKMANGIEEIFRERYSLKPEAIPTLNPTKLCKIRSNTNSSSNTVKTPNVVCDILSTNGSVNNVDTSGSVAKKNEKMIIINNSVVKIVTVQKVQLLH
ncbi:PREDICTED: uncharacterized protein LOC107073419 [Polistes dominula]|uniref:Uncharacterized protein LOC107073419 n=1 Tax=Polistes dominula TaxID=743375 RepID=A0ABM1JAQ9_POLDO|nr:PREDICTED: uncharacterized protein LOC107073419 [Polistes dominula]